MSESFQNGNFSSDHQITKHQYPHFQRQHEITTFVTDQNIHYTLLPMVHPGPVCWKAAAPKSQDYYNPLLELAMVLHCSQLFWGVVHFSGELGDASIKMLVVWFFPCVR
jgi:hypothetical protein